MGSLAALVLVPAALLAAMLVTRPGRRRLARAGGVAALAATGAWALAGAVLGTAADTVPMRRVQG